MLTKIREEDKATCKKLGTGRNAKYKCPNPVPKVWHGESNVGRNQNEYKLLHINPLQLVSEISKLSFLRLNGYF